jgi:hypothetical protein
VKKPPKYPRITPLKAFDLLRSLDEQRGREGSGTSFAEDAVREALANHVRAAIVRGSR